MTQHDHRQRVKGCYRCELSDDELTCEFGAYDSEGNAVVECSDRSYEEVVMADGGIVRLCRKHRSWAPALSPEDSDHK